MKYRDYYDTLGVPRTASGDEVRKAYRRLARKYHPDVSEEPRAEEHFKVLGEAYEVLKDPERRAAYDQLGSRWQAGQDFRPPPDWSQAFGFGARGGNAGDGRSDAGERVFSDFFETLFRGGQTARGPGRRSSSRRAGKAAPVRLRLPVQDAYRGVERQVRVADGRTLRIQVPPRVVTGQRIRLAGQDGRGGDLFLEVELEPHRYFRVEGRDVLLDLPVAPWEAALGATVSAPTLGGKVELRIPPGSQSGRRLRLRGKGLGGTEPGDQYVELRIVLPAADSDGARALYERMASELAFDPRAELHRG